MKLEGTLYTKMIIKSQFCSNFAQFLSSLYFFLLKSFVLKVKFIYISKLFLQIYRFTEIDSYIKKTYARVSFLFQRINNGR